MHPSGVEKDESEKPNYVVGPMPLLNRKMRRNLVKSMARPQRQQAKQMAEIARALKRSNRKAGK